MYIIIFIVSMYIICIGCSHLYDCYVWHPERLAIARPTLCDPAIDPPYRSACCNRTHLLLRQGRTTSVSSVQLFIT